MLVIFTNRIRQNTQNTTMRRSMPTLENERKSNIELLALDGKIGESVFAKR
jgi:hypothetical protein